MVARAFTSSTWEAEASESLEYEANLLYRVSFRTARATQKNHVLKNEQTKNNNNKCLLLRLSQVYIELIMEIYSQYNNSCPFSTMK